MRSARPRLGSLEKPTCHPPLRAETCCQPPCVQASSDMSSPVRRPVAGRASRCGEVVRRGNRRALAYPPRWGADVRRLLGAPDGSFTPCSFRALLSFPLTEFLLVAHGGHGGHFPFSTVPASLSPCWCTYVCVVCAPLDAGQVSPGVSHPIDTRRCARAGCCAESLPLGGPLRPPVSLPTVPRGSHSSLARQARHSSALADVRVRRLRGGQTASVGCRPSLGAGATRSRTSGHPRRNPISICATGGANSV